MESSRSVSSPNVLVCGAPRSGTSMMAQVLVDAGFHVGADLIAGSATNPNGFFEDIEINRRNDDLLASTDLVVGATRPPRSLSWIGAFTPTTTLGDHATMRDRLPPAPFVVKDPRFSFTYPAWRPLLGEHVVIVMVRPLTEVDESLQAMAARSPQQFDGYDLSAHAVRQLWNATYAAIDAWANDRTIFVSDSSLRDRSILPMLSERLERPLIAPNIEATLRRSKPASPTPAELPVFERCAIGVHSSTATFPTSFHT